jgi:AcrR family transcriptional regulator
VRTEQAARPKRADARRNEQSLLDAAAAVFVKSGVDAPVREIAEKAGVGMGTIYRHFPTRADLVVAVYEHQIEACVEAGGDLLTQRTPLAALAIWADLIVDFLVTKHGLAEALQNDQARFEVLHRAIIDRLVPVCGRLLAAAIAVGEVSSGIHPYGLMRGIGNLCVGNDSDPRYDARALVQTLIAGLAPITLIEH